MRSIRRSAPLGFAFCVLLLSGCSAGPTEKELDDYFSTPIQSAAGAWTGIANSSSSPTVTFAFALAQAANGTLTGNGTMQEQGQPVVQITITGSYQRPALTLNFSSMVYEGAAVQGAFQSQATFLGASGPLLLTGVGSTYDKTLDLGLFKQ